MADVLLVDDDPDQLALMRLAWKRERGEAQLHCARSGEEALAAVESLAWPPRLVLLDVKMPGMNGLATVRRLRARVPRLCSPIVMMSTSLAPSDIRDCLEAGANGYLRKPMVFEDWSRTIRSVAAYWLGLDRSVDGN